jgi:hypothetical protein
MSWTEDDLAAYYGRLKEPTEGAPVMDAPDVAESVIEAECTKILEADDWRALRTDPVSDRGRGKGFGEIGMADYLYVRYSGLGFEDNPKFDSARAESQVMWIEFKRPGERPKKHQVTWHIKERARGALTLIAGDDFPASVEGFRAWYEASGLQRRVCL